MSSSRRAYLLTTTAIWPYNEAVIGGCLACGVVPVHEALTDQDRQQGKSLDISSPTCCAGYDLDIASDFSFPQKRPCDVQPSRGMDKGR